MKKLLKIQFWLAEKSIAMQILEQSGLPEQKNDGMVRISTNPFLGDNIFLRGNDHSIDLDVCVKKFNDGHDYYKYFNTIIKSITDELFTTTSELKIGEMCEVWDSCTSSWLKRKLIAILPEGYKYRFLAEHSKYPTQYCKWEYARSIPKQIKPRIENCGSVLICTWGE